MTIRSSNEDSFLVGGAGSRIPPVSARPTRPALRERYDRRRQEMVFAAAREFARRGYDSTTMQDLAASMGLATGAVYHYFGSKEQLLIEICDQLMEPLLSRARELMRSDVPPEEKLRALLRMWVANVVRYRDHMLVFQQERHAIEVGAQWRQVRDSRKSFERLVGQALAQVGAGAGPGGDGRLALMALLGMVNHTAQWYRPRGRLTPEEIADGYLELMTAAAPTRSAAAA
jgi:TetR/AcrR family transcriptional regulator, cholesterol catabolism regulator